MHLLLPLPITSTPVNPVSSSQGILTAYEDTARLTAKNWELKPFPDADCSGDSTKTHNGTSTHACTVLADTPSKSYRFANTNRAFKVCFYNQKGCANEKFCGMNYGRQLCSRFGAKGPAVAFKIVKREEKCREEKCMEGVPAIREDHDSEVYDELDVELVDL